MHRKVIVSHNNKINYFCAVGLFLILVSCSSQKSNNAILAYFCSQDFQLEIEKNVETIGKISDFSISYADSDIHYSRRICVKIDTILDQRELRDVLVSELKKEFGKEFKIVTTEKATPPATFSVIGINSRGVITANCFLSEAYKGFHWVIFLESFVK